MQQKGFCASFLQKNRLFEQDKIEELSLIRIVQLFSTRTFQVLLSIGVEIYHQRKCAKFKKIIKKLSLQKNKNGTNQPYSIFSSKFLGRRSFSID